MAFKKSRGTLSNYVGSIQGDINSITNKLSSKFGSLGNLSNTFDQRISDGLSDLLTGATGIRTSNIPAISKQVLDMKGTNRETRASVLNDAMSGRTSPSGTPPTGKKLQFPTDWRTENNDSGNLQNYIHFRCLPRINGGVGEVNYDIFLYVPNEMKDNVSVEYEEANRGVPESVVQRMFGMGGGLLDSEEAKGLLIDAVDSANVVKASIGKTVNPMKFQLFKGVNMRTYSYSFTLYPETQSDSSVIREIAYAFKKSALPGLTGENNRLYTFPNEWAIRYHGPMKNWIDYPMTSVLSSVDVDYAVNGTQRMIDGAPQAVSITLSFNEVVTLDRNKYDNRVAAHTNKTGNGREISQEGGSGNDIRGMNEATVEEIQNNVDWVFDETTSAGRSKKKRLLELNAINQKSSSDLTGRRTFGGGGFTPE